MCSEVQPVDLITKFIVTGFNKYVTEYLKELTVIFQIIKNDVKEG